MECFLPTEIARLVYGYLIDEGCAEAGKMFLETSQHLKECVMFAAKGRKFTTKIFGCNLTEILDLLTEVTCYVKSIECDKAVKIVNLEEMLFQLKVILKLSTSSDTSSRRPVYLKLSVPINHQRLEKSKITDEDVTQKEDSDNSLAQPTDEIPPPQQPHALQVLLENKALHEKLAENINRIVATKSEVDSLERILEKKIVETIVNTTEQDPIFQQMLDELVGPVDIANSTPEDTEIESEDVQSISQPNLTKEPLIPDIGTVERPPGTEGNMYANQQGVGNIGMSSTIPTLEICSSPPSIDSTSGSSHFPTTEVSARNPPSILVPCCVVPNTLTSIVHETPEVPTASLSNSSIITSAVSTPLTTPRANSLVPRPSILTPVTQVVRSNGRKCMPASIIRILTTLPQPKNSLPPLLPRPVPPTPIRIGGVRTRGGMRGTLKTFGSKRTAKKVPNVATVLEEEKANISESDGTTENSASKSSISCESTTPISFTVSIVSQESVDTPSISSHTTSVAASSTPVVTSTATSDSCTPTLLAEVDKSTSAIVVEATPQQSKEPQVKLHKRLSLSTPRKASHVRALEFKTPPKNIKARRSMSSPKRKESDNGRIPDLMKLASDLKLQSIKRSELFKSPPKKEKKAWDADIRVYTVEDDVPTSVGLKRKEDTGPQISLFKEVTEEIEDSPVKMSEKSVNSESDEEIMRRIKKDVFDVIGEEDLTNNSCASVYINKSSDALNKSKMLKSPSQSPKANYEIGDIGVSSSTIKKLYDKTSANRDESSLDSPISKSPKEQKAIITKLYSDNLTPPHVKMSPDSSTPPTPSSSIIVDTLINECARIEKEEAAKRDLSVTSDSSKNGSFEEIKAPDISPKLLQTIPGIMSLETPAKSTFSIPVEMTPLSKIINEETRMNKCVLLTPTIPPTPDVQQMKGTQNSGHSIESETTPAKVIESQPTTANKEPSLTTMKSVKPYKTPQVRLKAKVKQDTPKVKSKGKKNAPQDEINCSKLIEQCLQKVKESLFSRSSSDSEKSDKRSPPSKVKNKKRHDFSSCKKLPIQKKEAINRKKYKLTRNNSEKKPLLNAKKVTTDSEEELSVHRKDNEKVSTESVERKVAVDPPSSILRSHLMSPGSRSSLKSTYIKESTEPKEVPFNLQGPASDQKKLDLDNYAFTFTLDSGGGKMIEHSLRTSCFFNLFEMPTISDSTESLTKLDKLSKESSIVPEEEETTRKRKPSSSLSSNESSSRKRSRSNRDDKEHRRHSRHSSRDRSWGRSPHVCVESRHQTPNRDSPHFRGHWRPRSRGRHDRGSFPRSFGGRGRFRKFDRHAPERSPPRSRSKSQVSSSKNDRISTSSRSHQSPVSSSDVRRQSKAKSPRSHSRVKDKHLTLSASIAKEKRNQRTSHSSDLEDGELTDSAPCFSPVKGASSSHETSQLRSTSPVKDESKQALLQQVGLDHFLSIVHGSDDRPTPTT